MSASAHARITSDPTADGGTIPAADPIGPALVMPATIAATDGRVLCRGVATVEAVDAVWSATVRRLDRPGVMASLFFGQRTRDVVLRLDDGRQARARIASTTFTAGRQRICELTGIEPLT